MITTTEIKALKPSEKPYKAFDGKGLYLLVYPNGTKVSEAATEWHRRDVNVALGVWQEGYITLHGLWCERLNGEVLQRMNRRLVEIKRNRREENSEVVPWPGSW